MITCVNSGTQRNIQTHIAMIYYSLLLICLYSVEIFIDLLLPHAATFRNWPRMGPMSTISDTFWSVTSMWNHSWKKSWCVQSTSHTHALVWGYIYRAINVFNIYFFTIYLACLNYLPWQAADDESLLLLVDLVATAWSRCQYLSQTLRHVEENTHPVYTREIHMGHLLFLEIGYSSSEIRTWARPGYLHKNLQWFSFINRDH